MDPSMHVSGQIAMDICMYSSHGQPNFSTCHPGVLLETP